MNTRPSNDNLRLSPVEKAQASVIGMQSETMRLDFLAARHKKTAKSLPQTFEKLNKDLAEEMARFKRERHSARERMERELGEVERGLERCLDFITSGDGAPGAVRVWGVE